MPELMELRILAQVLRGVVMVMLSKLIATMYIRGLEAHVLKDLELALNTTTA